MAGQLDFGKGAEPATPVSGKQTHYVTTDGFPRAKDSTGLILPMSAIDRPNLLVNSGLWFALRQNAAALTTYSSTAGRAFGPDQWAFTNENASIQYLRVDTSSGFESPLQTRYYGSVTKTTANGKIEVSQVIEADDIQALRGRTCRFQVWMKATTSTTIRIGVIQLTSAGTVDTIPATFISAHGGGSVDPTLGANLSYIAPKSGVTPDNCTANGNACDCTVTTSWQRFGTVIDVPTTAKNIIVMMWSNAQITTANGWSWSQAAFTDGYDIQEWNPLSITNERIRVARFYQKTFADLTTPTTAVGIQTGEAKGIAGKAGAVANSGFVFYRYQPPMRIAPGVTLFNPAAANALMRNATGAADMGATSTAANTDRELHINATGVAATAVGDQVGIHLTAEAGL